MRLLPQQTKSNEKPIYNNAAKISLIVLFSLAYYSPAFVTITVILSYFTLVFGELVPKRVAMKNYEKIAFATVGIIRAIAVVTAPFV
ncbi:MAG: DUF21 domain-containing protein, partial [Clostridia bacterium]|nr:DUF21 domain-containing protein [Clostridia bacterium]